MDTIDSANEIESSFNIKQYIQKVIYNWYLFAVCLLVCMFIAFAYYKTSPQSYKISGKILVRDNKGPSSSTKGLLSGDISDLLGTTNSADNEIEILTSRFLMEKVVKTKNLNITISFRGSIKTEELDDKDVPFSVQLLNQKDSLVSKTFLIDKVTEKTFRLTDKDNSVIIDGMSGRPIKFEQYDLLITRRPEYPVVTSPAYLVNIQSIDSRVEDLMKSLTVELTNKQSTTVQLTLNYSVPGKGEKILQSLMDLYLKADLEDKVRIADSTLSFIDERLVGVTSDLSGIEKQIEGFKKQNKLADITEQGKALIDNSSEYYKKLNDIELQSALINDISKYLKNPSNHRIIPSSLSVSDPVFLEAIKSYNVLLIDRDKETLSYTESNPVIKNLDMQIENTRLNLLKSFDVYKSGLNLSKQELVGKNGAIDRQISNVPGQERVYLDYSRQQEVKQQLYVYLLEKREETAISKTSTFSTSEIIDPAKGASEPFAPKKNVIYLIGLVLGLVLPLTYLSLRDMLNIRIQTKTDITSTTKTPIIGEISHSEDVNNLVVLSTSRSAISEQFRSLRTNLQYLVNSNKPSVILLTSSTSGEGKSFVSLNLGNTLAIAGKKVIFLELDLRKPKLSANMGMDNSNGFTNYIISDHMQLSDIIKPVPFHENTFLISSGPVPPNPAEILLNDKFGLMIAELKNKFDYIIIDTAPVGLVSDALIIENFVDLSIYLVRQKYTLKNSITNFNELVDGQKLRNPYIVVNDIVANRGGYYGYGYGGYGYGYGYGGYGGYGTYGMEGKKSFFARMMEKFKKS
jgi:tyrosine-protein kinase Etk/Wzc